MTGRNAPGVLGAEDDPLEDELDGGDRVGDFKLSEWPFETADEPLLREALLPLLLPFVLPLAVELVTPLLLLALELLFNSDDTGYWSVLVSSNCS